ncbi:MAG: hypothetical protein HY456_00130 [Parcubacteria group bacterium]|nr:hypothetical protein [Parcubacteria group bacterium]
MPLTLKINAVDRSNHVKWDTLQKVEVLSKEVDRMEFEILKTPSKTIPDVGQEITLDEGANKIFGGVIVERNEVNKGGLLLGYHIRCKDYSQFLDRKVVTKSYANQTARAIILDIISTFTSGFTTANVAASTPTVASIKFNYEQVTRCLTQLADQIAWDWYVDYDKDIHFFDTEANPAPFNLDDTTGNFEWKTLEINKSLLQLKNAVFVRGGEYKKTISEANAIDKYKAATGQKTFALAYKYDNITVKKNGAVQTIGTDQQTDPATVNLLYNFNEKFITFSTGLASGDDVVVYGDAFIPIIALVKDQVSIATYGEYQTPVVDKSITSINEAQTRAKAELKKYAESVFESRFKTTKTGLKVGHQINLNSTIRNINKNFKINRIVGKARGSDHMEYEIFMIASGQITFTDIMVNLLGQDKKNIVIATNEVLQRLEFLLESLTLSELLTAIKDSPPYRWGAGSANDFRWNFFTWS